MLKDEKDEDIIDIVMLVLVGLVKRVQKVGYNDFLSDSVVELIYYRYRNRLSFYYFDSDEYEFYLRVYIWVFGNLGYYFGFLVIF